MSSHLPWAWRWTRAAGAAAALALLTGCAGRAALVSFPRPEPALLPTDSPLRSASLSDGDAWLRHFVMEARLDSARLALSDSSAIAPADELQRMLQAGVVLHEAGEYAPSNRAFEWAEREADLRYTRSVTRAVATLLTSDAVMDYTPSRAEMAMIPYYRMKNYLALGDLEGAAVEARKAGHYLARLEDEAGDACAGGAGLAYLAGLVHDAVGERDDALVSYRRAAGIFDACAERGGVPAPGFLFADLARAAREAGMDSLAALAGERYDLPGEAGTGDDGSLVVLLDQGFVAHRVSRALHVPLFEEEIEGLDVRDAAAVLEVAGTVTARLLDGRVQQAPWGSALDDEPGVQLARALEGAYVMKLSWPEHRLEANRAATVRVIAGGEAAAAPVLQDVSAAVVRDFERTRSLVLARAVGRALTKLLAARAIEKKAEEAGGFGFLAGALANLAGNALERADTRSWSLLPDQVAMARLRLPPGEHAVRLELLDADGTLLDTRELGTVTIEPGRAAFVSHRTWGPDAGDPARLAHVARGVEREAAVDSVSAPRRAAR